MGQPNQRSVMTTLRFPLLRIAIVSVSALLLPALAVGQSRAEKSRDFWSFQPVTRPAVPSVKRADWVRTPIDAFILARLEAKGLVPAPPADKIALIRRVSYDLTGLPPTPSEVDAFVADSSNDAYADLVERLLRSPRYGERWARHWLDCVRFAETNSFERDTVKPFAWRFRDYVIRAFNDDKPYDQFVREQLAGDEFDEVTADSVTATGFYRLGAWDDEPTDRLQARYDELDDILTTTSQVFLGLTVNCARCHDHKLDPVPQEDYYRLLAFFHNIRPYHKNEKPEGTSILRPIPGQGDDRALCVMERGREAPETHVLIRGNAHAKGDKVEPGFPRVLGTPDPKIPAAPEGVKSTGRRTALANWIASDRNPLAARVMVNRIWQYHFGRGIVRSPNNFGNIGARPTHPKLLDWLAAEFAARGWRLKEMHRLILLSSTYRMSSRGNADGLAKDPENDSFWRFDMRRLAAEEIRDSILAVNGTLNFEMGGPGVYTLIPKAVLQGQSIPGAGWGKSSPEQRARRSIYIHAKRSLIDPMLASFDMADTDTSCPVRFSTTQATQALGMLNSDFLNREAALFADRLREEAGHQTKKQVRLALRLATSRKPTDAEIDRGVKLIAALGDESGATAEAALNQFCLLVLNLNEFVYLD